MMKLKALLPFAVLILAALSSCKKDELITDSSAKLEFSTDTVMFDTVFHFASSVTKVFRIYNQHDQPINISKAYLAGGTSSPFKLNIDGISTTSSMPVLTDIEILGGDSMYVFVQVFVDPAGSLPILVRDSIIFETNGNIQDVKLLAIGQDVYLHKPLPGEIYSIMSSVSGADTTLPNDKPHLVFGYVVVDSARKVILQAGTKFYMHNHSVLWVYRDGTLVIDGALGNEVKFQGDRLESEYNDVPGQWGKIWYSKLSKNNTINYAIIKNGQLGIQVDTMASLTTPTLTIANTIVKNMSAAGLFTQGAHVRAENSLFVNCGLYLAALTIGGKYKFEHCTFGNYWNYDTRTTESVAFSNHYTSVGGAEIVRDLDSCYFGNCIIYGARDEEIALDSSLTSGNFKYEFDHCVLKTQRTFDVNHYVTCVGTDPQFSDPGNSVYKLSSTSTVVDLGYPSTITVDILNQPRPAGPGLGWDPGCYERNP